MRLRNDEALALARQLSQRAANVHKTESYTVTGECRLLAAILAGAKQDVLDLGQWLVQRARYWETQGDRELAEACWRVAVALDYE